MVLGLELVKGLQNQLEPEQELHHWVVVVEKAWPTNFAALFAMSHQIQILHWKQAVLVRLLFQAAAGLQSYRLIEKEPI